MARKVKPVNTVFAGGRHITYVSVLPDDIDERVEKIQARLEELKPEFQAMAEELEKIGWDLEDSYKDLWQSSNSKLQSKKHDFAEVQWLSDWLKEFRVNPH